MAKNDNPIKDKIEGSIRNDFVNALFNKAGRGKDELIQILGKEIGSALAAMLKEPLNDIIKDKKISMSIEIVDKKPKITRQKKSTSKKKV